MVKVSELTEATTLSSTDEFYVNRAGAPRRINLANLSTVMGSGLPSGWIDAGAFVDPRKHDVWTWANGTEGSAEHDAADSTADFQALFDYVGNLALTIVHTGRAYYEGGFTILIPKGAYMLKGSVTLPNMPAGMPLHIMAHSASFIHWPEVGDPAVSMFKTGLPTDNNDAEAKNDVRNMWTWSGGHFYGRLYANQTCFEWNAVSRMVMERVFIQSFEVGIRGRFVLHFKLRDSVLFNCRTYQIQIEASGSSNAWTGATPGNAASNGTVIENVRFYGASTEIAQVRIAHSGHTIRDCTFEGGAPANTADGGGYNIMFYNTNTSVLTSIAENCWIENTPAVAHVYINTPHGYEFDLQYSNSSAPIADVWQTSLTTFRRVPWPAVPTFKLDSGTLVGGYATNVKLFFDHSGPAGEMNLANAAMWVNGVRPKHVTSVGIDDEKMWRTQTLGYNRRIYEMVAPGSNVLNVGDTEAALWTVAAQGI